MLWYRLADVSLARPCYMGQGPRDGAGTVVELGVLGTQRATEPISVVVDVSYTLGPNI